MKLLKVEQTSDDLFGLTLNQHKLIFISDCPKIHQNNLIKAVFNHETGHAAQHIKSLYMDPRYIEAFDNDKITALEKYKDNADIMKILNSKFIDSKFGANLEEVIADLIANRCPDGGLDRTRLFFDKNNPNFIRDTFPTLAELVSKESF